MQRRRPAPHWPAGGRRRHACPRGRAPTRPRQSGSSQPLAQPGRAAPQFDADVCRCARRSRFALNGYSNEACCWQRQRRLDRLLGHLALQRPPTVHHIHVQPVKSRDHGDRRLRLAARLQHLLFELRAVPPMGLPPNRLGICVQLFGVSSFHCGHNTCDISSYQGAFAGRLLQDCHHT